MSEIFEVIRTGVLATVQDLGRWGYQRFGMAVSGAMDSFALQVGNILVGNGRGEAAIEIALGGLALRAMADAVVAICGGDLGANLDGRPAPMWNSFPVRRGQELSWGAAARGAWAYLTVAGGIDVPVVMGSKSTYLRAKVGGFHGRALGKGDVLQAGSPAQPLSACAGQSLAQEDVPAYGDSVVARVISGPQAAAFAPEAMAVLLSNRYEVTAQSDRMGYRLKGPALRHKDSADILSDALTFGSIQAPADGQPIVLMADRQTIGGYAKIATVVSADLPLLAQRAPGAAITFAETTIEQAQALAARQEQFLAGLMRGM